MKVKLADFGFARKLQVGRDFTKFYGGTFQTIASDIWSFGIIIYEILEYHHPFLRADEALLDLDIALRIVELEPYDLSPNRSDSLRALIKRMLVKDPSKRITAEEILEWPEIKAIIMKPDEEQKQDKDEDI
ncbi:MAG: hypothetical protein EZS28_008373 [Streblomastix strix]|uniref:non-specific serine/threonine protein kinase n=1 Tax=Streblomastix strix TaxID=222440 RepID=A0A5J4WPI1_9EUKA|nr:MAG: hypothetical protein EZS28_008373 [Streblomastix strix]